MPAKRKAKSVTSKASNAARRVSSGAKKLQRKAKGAVTKVGRVAATTRDIADKVVNVTDALTKPAKTKRTTTKNR